MAKKRQAPAVGDGAGAGACVPRGKKPLNMPRSALLRVDAACVRRRRCVVAYDGALYCGFQAQEQPDSMPTVQEAIEYALRRTTGETLRLRFASRTDTGVSARGQVVVFSSGCVESDRVLRDALNTRLPPDVLCRRLRTMREDEADFDPCADARRKRYVYELQAGGLRPVQGRQHLWHVRKPLNVSKMQDAAARLLAPPAAKDYSSFTPQKSGDGGKDNVCTLSRLDVDVQSPDQRLDTAGSDEEEDEAGTRIRLTFEGDRFRYKMVRNLVGTLVDVGLGRLAPEDIPVILAARSRAKAGQGAPPHGLTLLRVWYD